MTPGSIILILVCSIGVMLVFAVLAKLIEHTITKRKFPMKSLFALLLTALALVSTEALAQPTCPALPSYITAPCVIRVSNLNYQLHGDLNGTAGGSAPVIGIQSGIGNIQLNCNGYRIENNANEWTNTGAGIEGRLVANVTIKNCLFAGAGLETCITIDNGGSGRAFKGITLENNTCSATVTGFYVDSDNAKFLGNYVVNVGGATHCSSGYRSFGIHVTGGPVVVNDNRIWRVWNRCYLEAVGVSFSHINTDVEMKRNHILNDRVVNSAWIAVWLGSQSGPYTIEANVLDRWYYGFVGYAPIVGGNTLAGTSLITNTVDPIPSIGPPLWTVIP